MNPSSLVRYLFIVGISTSIGRSFAAQPVTLAPATTGYSLTAIIEQALARNEWALSFAERIQEKKFAADQARRWRNPELNFAAGRKEVASSDGSIIEASLAQPIFLPGKLQLRGKIAGADTEMAVLNRTKNEIALRHQVVRLAYRYSVDRQKSEFARQRRERFELIRSYLSGRPFASPQKKAERHLVENRLRELMVENLEIETSRKNSLERLKLYTPLDESTAGSVEIPWLKGDNHLDRSQWETAGREKNPDLAAQRLELSRASQELALAKKERWPDFSLSVFYRRETANETEKASGAGIALPLPVLNLNSAAIHSLEKKREAEEHLLRFNEQEFQSRMIQALNDYGQAAQVTALYPSSLGAQLQEQIKEVESAFRKGQLDLLSFLELDTQTAETYYRMLDAQAVLAEKLTDLFSLAGQADLHRQLNQF